MDTGSVDLKFWTVFMLHIKTSTSQRRVVRSVRVLFLKAADHHSKILHTLKVLLLLLGGKSIWQFTVFMQVTSNGFILKHLDGLLHPAALGSNCGITWVGRSDVQTTPTGPVLMRSCSLDASTAQSDHGAVDGGW